MNEWYYARGNQQQGPVPLQAIQDMARSGQLQPTDLVWRQGMPNWLPASQVSEVFAQAAASPAYAPPHAPPHAVPGTPAGYGVPGQQGNYYGQPQQPRYQGDVPNYLVQAILVTLFCCVPFGIVSIVYAAQVNSKLTVGDYAGAVDASGKAKTWSMWGFACGLIAVLAWVGLVILGAMAEAQ